MSRLDAEPGPQAPLHERLRFRRQASGLDLESLSSETKIQRRYFEAIELGQVHLLPQGVYMRNFIRIYLRAIGMDSPTELQATIDTLTSGVLRLPMVSSLPPSSRRQQDPDQTRASALMVGAALFLAVAGWLLWRYVQQWRTGPADGAVASASLTPGPAPQPTVPVLTSAPVPPSPTPRPSGAGVALHALRKTSVILKGRSGSETPINMQKDETVEVYLGEPTVLELSNAGAVEITIQGRKLPSSRLRSTRTLAVDPANIEPLFEEVAEPTGVPATPRSKQTRTPTSEDGAASEADSETEAADTEAAPTRKPRKPTPTVDEDADDEEKAVPSPTRKSRKATPTEEPAGERVYPDKTSDDED